MAIKRIVTVDSDVKIANGKWVHTHAKYGDEEFEDLGVSYREFMHAYLDKVFDGAGDLGTVSFEVVTNS